MDFEKTTTFTRKPYQYYEDIAIKIKIPMLQEAKKLIESFRKLISYIYSETEDYNLRNIY